jgi:hypothetical protein
MVGVASRKTSANKNDASDQCVQLPSQQFSDSRRVVDAYGGMTGRPIAGLVCPAPRKKRMAAEAAAMREFFGDTPGGTQTDDAINTHPS